MTIEMVVGKGITRKSRLCILYCAEEWQVTVTMR